MSRKYFRSKSRKGNRKSRKSIKRRSSRQRRSSKKSYCKKMSPLSRRCKNALKKKVEINIKEYKKGRYVSRAQAVAVSYSQIKKKYPKCSRSLRRKTKK
jgi:hypothetical protein